MRHVHLATGLAIRDDSVLLVASHYPNHPQPLWNLPGGRQNNGELLNETAAREVFEETGYRATVRELAYLSESYDRAEDVHFLNATFLVDVTGGSSFDKLRMTGDHVVDVGWVPIAELPSRIAVAVVREPLIAYLERRLPARYSGFEDSGITIRWPEE